MFKRWGAKNGYKESLTLGMPLVISMLSSTVMTFTDRIFLGNYSMEALGASLPASITAYLFLSFFIGTAEYIGVFVSQYTGAGRHRLVGEALWQGIWFCVPSGLFLASLWFIAGPLFDWVGHAPDIRLQEVIYFRILTVGGGPYLLGICLSCFFSGRGMTKPVMLVNMFAAVINIPLDYCLINGVGPFPELGIVGAGTATVMAYVLIVVCYALLIFNAENESCYRVRSTRRLVPSLMKRFLHFGLPGGVQFFLDMFGVSFFVFMVGRIGAVELAASNIAISIYTLAFMPTIGMHIAASIMVGQAMGSGKPDAAAYATKSVLHLALLYMAMMGVLFLVLPVPLLELFHTRAESGVDFGPVVAVGTLLLRYVVAFTLVDAVAIVYVGALKGAGDSRFTMTTMGTASIVCLVIPTWLLDRLGYHSVHGPWACLLTYAVVLAVLFAIRFARGSWRSIRVIEH